MNILKNAIDLHQKNKFEQAKNLYEKILEQEPKNFEATHLLACLNIQIKNFDNASQLINRTIKDRKSTRLNSSHSQQSRMPSSA